MAMIESKHRATSDPDGAAARPGGDPRQEGRVRPLLVHRSRGASEELRDHPGRDRGGARRRDGLRRLVDHGLQRDRGVGHGRDPRPGDVPADAERRQRRRPDDLRHRQAGRHAVRGRPALRAPAGARADGVAWASTPSTSAPSSSTSSSRTTRARTTLDEGGYFAMTTMDAATELRNETIKALESMGIPIEYHHHEVAPSQHEIDMRYAARARHGRPHDHLPADREGGREEGRLPRDLHAEAALRRERLGHAHAHVALHGRAERVLRRRRRAPPLRRPAKAFIAGLLRHARELSAVFAQWVNSYKRLVPGYEAPVYVAWSQRNRSALIRIPLYKPGSEQATRAEIRCPDPGVQPVPHLRGAPARGARGDRAGLRARGADGHEPLPPDARAAEGARDRLAAGDARRGDRRVRRLRADAQGASATTSSTTT